MEIPAPLFPFRHRIDCQMRFNDYDILGHLNNSSYLVLADLGKSRYFTDVAPHLWSWRTVSLVIASIKCDFFAPAFPDEPLNVLTAVSRISTHTIVLEQRIVNPEKDDQVKCIVTSVMVNINTSTLSSEPIPAQWREVLESYEQRAL